MILLSPVSLYLIVLFLIGGFTAVINVIEMVIFTIFPWIAVPIGLIAILLIIILNQVNRKAFAKVKVRKIILIILACIVITMAITWGSWFPYLDVRSNQCEYNGIKYKEFSKHPIKDCWCEGQGDGVEKAVWVCKGG